MNYAFRIPATTTWSTLARDRKGETEILVKTSFPNSNQMGNFQVW